MRSTGAPTSEATAIVPNATNAARKQLSLIRCFPDRWTSVIGTFYTGMSFRCEDVQILLDMSSTRKMLSAEL